MTIIENKLKIILIIIIFWSFLGLIIGFYNLSFNSWEQENLNFDDKENISSMQSEGVDWMGGLLGILLLQITGAPAEINVITGLIVSCLIISLTLVIASYVREMIGLT